MKTNDEPGGSGAPSGAPPTPDPAQGTPPVPVWSDSLPADLKGEKTLSKFKSVEDLARGYLGIEKVMGGAVRIPADGATDAEKNDFWTKMGRPTSPDGYGEYKPPEGMEWSKESESRFKKRAHEMGLSAKQATGLLDWYTQESEYARQSISEEVKAEETKAWAALREMWGPVTDRNVALAQRVVMEVGGEDLSKALNETGLGNNPAFLRFAAKIGEMMVEDGLIRPDSIGMGKADVQKELDLITSNSKHAYWNREDPGHMKALERVRELHLLLEGAV